MLILNLSFVPIDCPDHLEVKLNGDVLKKHETRAGKYTKSNNGSYWTNQHGNAIWYFRNQWRIGYSYDLNTSTEGIHSKSIKGHFCPDSRRIQWKYAAFNGTFHDADDNVLIQEVQAGKCDFLFICMWLNNHQCQQNIAN